MSTTRPDVRDAAKILAQDPGTSGVALLLSDPDSYDAAIDMALGFFSRDRPNRRVIHQTIATTGWRQVLAGTGVWSGLTGLDAWVDGLSAIDRIVFPWAATSQAQDALDPTTYGIVRDPGGLVILEFLDAAPAAGQVVRLEFTRPHVVDEDTDASTSLKAGDVKAFNVLTGAMVLQIAATKAAQNTGNTGLPNDVVDRRSQSDILRSRAKELLDVYRTMIGAPGAGVSGASGATASTVPPASGFKDLDARPFGSFGPMFHTARGR